MTLSVNVQYVTMVMTKSLVEHNMVLIIILLEHCMLKFYVVLTLMLALYLSTLQKLKVILMFVQ